MAAVLLSRVIGYFREAYIAWAFGAGPRTDAYVAAFTIPDWLNYLVAGGAASITFISIFARYLAQEKHDEAKKAFSIVITVMTAVLAAGILLAEVFTRPLERVFFHDFTPQQLDLCVYLTRIVLPAQIFFYVGGVLSAVLYTRRQFLFPALTPILYNVFIILGGVLLHNQFGIASLAIGAVAGGFIGPFLINAIGAARTGIGYRPSFQISHPAFREWIRLTIPLMLGFSLVTVDDWILRYFASGGAGDITRLNYAKRLLQVPIAVLGQAAGQASLPFFARLFSEGKREEFARAVNGSVYRITALSILATSWMVPLALPLVDLVYRRGKFAFSDSVETASFLAIFGLSLAFWAAQALYARAFYAGGNTLAPMVASTIVTIASLPVYRILFHAWGVRGLAFASDLGIVANALVLTLLLHYRRIVLLNDLPWLEYGKVLVAAIAAFAAAYGLLRYSLGNVSAGPPALSHLQDIWLALKLTGAWASVAVVLLFVTRSDLPGQLRRRRASPKSPLPINQSEFNQP